MLQVSDLTVGYHRDDAVLREVCLDLTAVAVHAIVGPNGAGKSTLLHTLAGHLRPTAGTVWCEGRDVTRWRPHQAARTGVALAPQGRRLWPSLTVAEHLTVTRPARHRPGSTFSVDELLEVFPALAGRLHHHGHQLSGGEQQMLTIARALHTAPRLLLADEPTEGLAPTVARQVTAVLQQLPQRGATVLVTLPHVRAAAALTDTVHVLTTGHLSHPVTASDGQAERLLRDHLTLTNPHAE
ncbi:ABC transporter ATP-binding protein [Micromonospora endolithica]|uniref:ATP-binding cassette domain-containing protein n=1 Tax=Micromonospora endolithica TaxID=230091 RepID=A0A3A9ZS83_9ACTN|nr:ATP-binding cassette domain-containing protein [Micromonospora endolithica]RKN50456.1 ATP-binding cassette domain-containing protein [Micromonospora endolithica]TWJ20858.1 branched-chain amino acid transport system ATP-binding protein [Micromonospora endolithica]